MTPVFTADWSASREHWPKMLAPLRGQPLQRFLEIGCYEGQTSLWLLENILTDPTCRLDVIDPFTARESQREDFDANLAPYLDRILVWPYPSSHALRLFQDLPAWLQYDFIYVDGDHAAASVLEDAVLSWGRLRKGGLMCFDDYDWPAVPNELVKPTIAVDAFAACYADRIRWDGPVGADQYLIVKD